MLTVTDAALQHLQTALSKADTAESACFRFAQQADNSIGLMVHEPETGDQTFECDGETVLAAPGPLAKALAATILDVDDDGQLVLLPQAA